MKSFMKQHKQRLLSYSFATLVSVILLIQAFYLANLLTPIDNMLFSDFANYSIAILQTEDSTLFANDPMWSNGALRDTFWASSGSYMLLNQILYEINGDNFAWTNLTLRVFSSTLIVYGFYLLFFSISSHRIASFFLALTVLSIVNVLALSVPTGFSFAFMSFAMIGIYHWLIVPSLEKKPVQMMRLFILGFIIGISPLVFGSVNGLAFVLWLGVVTGIQLLLQQMKFSVFLIFWLGIIPIFIFVILFGAGGATGQMSDESAQWLITTISLSSFDIIINFALACLLIAFAGTVVAIKQTTWAKIFFVFTNIIVWITYGFYESGGQFIYLYVLAVFFALLVVYRILLKNDTKLDYAFIIGITASAFMGPVLQRILHLLWEMTGWHTLLAIMWQMYRFSDIVFLPFFMGFFCTLINTMKAVPNPLYALMLLFSLCLSIYMGFNRYPSPEMDYFAFFLAGLSCTVLMIIAHPKLQDHFNFKRLLSDAFWVPFGIIALALITVIQFLPDWASVWLASLFIMAVVWLLTSKRASYIFAMSLNLILVGGLYSFFPLQGIHGFDAILFYSLSALVFVGMPIVFLARSYTRTDALLKQFPLEISRNHRAILAFVIIVGILITITPYSRILVAKENFDYASSSFFQERMDWLDIQFWIHDNTPQDALFHTSTGRTFNENIRANARRSVLVSWMDGLNAPYAQLEPIDLHNLNTEGIYYESTDNLVRFAAKHNVDYLVLNIGSSQTLPDSLYNDALYQANAVYQNNYYIIYRVSSSPALARYSQ